MTKTAAKTDAKARKASRDKKIAAVLGVVFLVVLAIEGPTTLKRLHGGSSAPAASSTAATSPSDTVAATGQTSPLPASPGASVSLSNSDVAPRRTKSQLLSFGHFRSKDPFVQQVSTEPPASASATATPSTGSTGTVPNAAVSSSAAPSSTGANSTSATYSTAATANPPAQQASGGTAGAVVEVNGRRESVAVGKAFPKRNPTFRLLSFGHGVAEIGIAGGSYASGAQSVALRPGRTLTLLNTADGMRYELQLVSTP